MPTENSRIIRSFLKSNLYLLESDTSGGADVDLPNYEIHPREFLDFAKYELDDLKTNRSIVNCLSNLKRAIDCQIDIFLHALNLLDIYKDRRLGIDKKLGFIEKCGIFSRRSLSRMNTVRNRLEHDYELPDIQDISIYYDLSESFLTVLENQILLGGPDSNILFVIKENTSNPDEELYDQKSKGRLSSNYDSETCSHTYKWEFYDGGESLEYIANATNLDELASFIKYHRLLLNIYNTYHGKYATYQLEKL